MAKAVELRVKSFCCPAIGCGVRGFPAALAARAGLHHLVMAQIPYVEAGTRSPRPFLVRVV